MSDETYNLKITKREPIPPDPKEPYDPWAGVFGPRKEPTMAVPQIHMLALKDHLAGDGRRLKGDITGGDDGAPYILHSEEEAAKHVALGLGKRVSPPAKEGAEAETEEPAVDAPWTLGVPPDQYLAKWPQGPNAAQARAILEKKAAEAKTAETAKQTPPPGPRPVS